MRPWFYYFLYFIFKYISHEIQLMQWGSLIKCAHWHNACRKNPQLLRRLSTLPEGGVFPEKFVFHRVNDNSTWSTFLNYFIFFIDGTFLTFLPDMFVIFFASFAGVFFGVPTVAFFCELWDPQQAGLPSVQHGELSLVGGWHGTYNPPMFSDYCIFDRGTTHCVQQMCIQI